ncbi:FMN-dependent NADH-azoreductase [Staphylococcus canis]|uniref:FMN dependent NADH:quinone oxidoreductase n=1 Tax=Staphylococcus canis TaxID=2724942 RepID=A0ABS0TAI1_9STAP|nr:FMN-dependent NADH-azoreductase [Staphylococcus canis]MBI5975744.1 FMN-dependent NADH-azoreductase [Staphylococcus canis]
MTKLLYITAHPLDELVSASMAAGKSFIESYKEANPSDEVVHIDLFKEDIPQIDADVFSGWGKLQNGEELTEEESRKVNRLGEIVDEFINADKYVFVSPMWNLSFPPVLKAYFDAVSVAGKTFKYTSEGAVGLLTDKKALHIQARGGIYTEGPAAPLEHGDSYVKSILGFYGVPSYETVIVEGHNAMPEKAEEIKQAAIQKAAEVGKQF